MVLEISALTPDGSADSRWQPLVPGRILPCSVPNPPSQMDETTKLIGTDVSSSGTTPVTDTDSPRPLTPLDPPVSYTVKIAYGIGAIGNGSEIYRPLPPAPCPLHTLYKVMRIPR